MRIALACLFTLCFISCGVKIVPLKGTYPTPPITYSTESDFESVWSRLVDFFAEAGISIKIIDKSSGLIVTEPYNFKDTYTFEMKDGSLNNPKKWLVVQKYFDKAQRKFFIPNTILGDWNVRVKKTTGGTSINVNITNIKTYNFYTSYNGQVSEKGVVVETKTTGEFEKSVFEKIK